MRVFQDVRNCLKRRPSARPSAKGDSRASECLSDTWFGCQTLKEKKKKKTRTQAKCTSMPTDTHVYTRTNAHTDRHAYICSNTHTQNAYISTHAAKCDSLAGRSPVGYNEGTSGYTKTASKRPHDETFFSFSVVQQKALRGAGRNRRPLSHLVRTPRTDGSAFKTTRLYGVEREKSGAT